MAYNPDFIAGQHVSLPRIPTSKKKDIAALLNGKGFLIDYSRHSVAVNSKRKFAFFSACNINGAEWKSLPRKGGFRKDHAIDASHQLGDELYNAIQAAGLRPNDFEQGHLTAYQQVLWGKTDG